MAGERGVEGVDVSTHVEVNRHAARFVRELSAKWRDVSNLPSLRWPPK